MVLEEAKVTSHQEIGGAYRLLELEAPRVAQAARPGQFVHVRVPGLENAALRRPFSICSARAGRLRILYKVVGRGTVVLAGAAEGSAISLLGPLGNTFPLPADPLLPVAVAGGYGVAPLVFLAETIGRPGVAFLGGRTAGEVLMRGAFSALGWEERIATDDGTIGSRGLVTNAFDAWAAADAWRRTGMEVYACGPDGMLRAVGERAGVLGVRAWLSLDRHMGCGVGACLGCVVRLRRGQEGREEWGRVCTEGPVFEAGRVAWGGEDGADGP